MVMRSQRHQGTVMTQCARALMSQLERVMRSQRHQKMQKLPKAVMLSGWSLIWRAPVVQAGPTHPSIMFIAHIHPPVALL